MLFRKRFFAILVTLLVGLYKTKAQQKELDAGIIVPLGEFSQSHIVGAGADFNITIQQFKNITLLGNAGTSFIIGKKIAISGYDFTFGNNIYTTIRTGISYNLTHKLAITTLTGPGWSYYRKSNTLGWNAAARVSFSIHNNKKIGIGFLYRKEKEVQPLTALTVFWGFSL